MQRSLAALRLSALVPLVAPAADAPSWPCHHGPDGNFSGTDCGLTLVEDLKDARLLWKSQEPTPPGAAQSPRYGAHGWHGISLKDFKPINIPLAGGGEGISGSGISLPGGGASSPLVADRRADSVLNSDVHFASVFSRVNPDYTLRVFHLAAESEKPVQARGAWVAH